MSSEELCLHTIQGFWPRQSHEDIQLRTSSKRLEVWAKTTLQELVGQKKTHRCLCDMQLVHTHTVHLIKASVQGLFHHFISNACVFRIFLNPHLPSESGRWSQFLEMQTWTLIDYSFSGKTASDSYFQLPALVVIAQLYSSISLLLQRQREGTMERHTKRSTVGVVRRSEYRELVFWMCFR